MRIKNASLVAVASFVAFSVFGPQARAESPCGGCNPPTGYTRVCTAADLDLIRTNPAGSYYLCHDIEVYATIAPLPVFTGHLDGNHFGVLGATISQPGVQSVGLFSEIAQAASVTRL